MVDIGLAGAMGAGKTTAADLLVAGHGYTRLSFADPIRHITVTLLGRAIDKKHDRSTMQRIGRAARSPEWKGIDTPFEEGRRERTRRLAEFIFPGATPDQVQALYRTLYDEGYSYGWGDESYWIRRWHGAYIRAAKPVVVDDARFPVEGDYLQRLGFFVGRLDVPFEERQHRVTLRDGHWDPAWTNDPTEALVAEIPVHVDLNGLGDREAIAEHAYQEALSWKARTQGHPVK